MYSYHFTSCMIIKHLSKKKNVCVLHNLPVSLFFRFSEGSARAHERRSHEMPHELCLSRLAPSVTRAVICVSHTFLPMDKEKERLIIV